MASVVCALTYKCCACGELAGKAQIHNPETFYWKIERFWYKRIVQKVPFFNLTLDR